jgi:hypothetical protein
LDGSSNLKSAAFVYFGIDPSLGAQLQGYIDESRVTMIEAIVSRARSQTSGDSNTITFVIPRIEDGPTNIDRLRGRFQGLLGVEQADKLLSHLRMHSWYENFIRFETQIKILPPIDNTDVLVEIHRRDPIYGTLPPPRAVRRSQFDSEFGNLLSELERKYSTQRSFKRVFRDDSE